MIPKDLGDPCDRFRPGLIVGRRIGYKNCDGKVFPVRESDNTDIVGSGGYAILGAGCTGLVGDGGAPSIPRMRSLPGVEFVII